jgi:hypothetical protein
MPAMPMMPQMPMTMPMMAPMQQMPQMMPQMSQMTPEMMMQCMMMMRSMYPMPMGFMMPPSMMTPMSKPAPQPEQPILTPKSLEIVETKQAPEPVAVPAAEPVPVPVAAPAKPVAAEDKKILPTFIPPPKSSKPAQKATPTQKAEKQEENVWKTRQQKQKPKKAEPIANDIPVNPDEIALIDHTQFPKHYPAWIDPRTMNEFKWLQATINKYKIPFKLKEKKGELRNCSLSSEAYPDFMFCVNYYNKDKNNINNIIFYDTKFKYGDQGQGLIIRMIEFYEGGGVRRYSIYDPESKHYHVALYNDEGDWSHYFEKTKLNSFKAEDIVQKREIISHASRI